MLWTFERNGVKRLVEVRAAMDGNGYELRRLDVEGREVIERFQSAEELSRRVSKVEKDLLEDGWSLAGAAKLQS